MTLAERLRVLQRGWAVLLLFTMLGTLGALGTVLLATPRFDATARLFISTAETGTPLESLASSIYARTRILSYATVASDPVVLRPVAVELGLDESLDELSQRVKATPLPDSLIIEIVASSRFNTEAKNLANAVANQLVDVIELQLESEMTDEGSNLKISIVDAATVPESPAAPQLVPSLMVGFGGGLIIGIGMMLSRHSFDTRLRTVRDITDITDTRILGTITRERDELLDTIMATGDESAASHDFRSLRTALRYVGFEAQGRSILVTGVGSGQGTTTVAVNLALAIAQQGRRVLIIDAHVRSPDVLDFLGLEANTGLTDILIGSPLDDSVQHWPDVPELFVMHAGTLPPRTGDLLGTPRMARLLRGLEERYDDVIIDSPPVSRVVDTRMIAPLVGSVVLVARAGRARRDDLLRSITALEGADNLSGIVVTDVAADRSEYASPWEDAPAPSDPKGVTA